MARAFDTQREDAAGAGADLGKDQPGGQGNPMYDRKLSVAEVQQRIERYWRPYHAALAQAIRWSVDRFGGVWHINLHSMPSDVFVRLGQPERQLADFVLGTVMARPATRPLSA